MLKFSTSPRRLGWLEIIIINSVAVRRIGRESFLEKNGLNLILSFFVKVLVGFEDPVSCRSSRCISIIAIKTIGRMKWSEKNRFRVG